MDKSRLSQKAYLIGSILLGLIFIAYYIDITDALSGWTWNPIRELSI
ncbi:hypothetical protein Toce_0995 [Thermosediminibacter oceani DSM 16646]|uniref:Uncharacterized protein n=1 Tax=Thermosediminibacter oceani (strain ATCC BAA-1034 / DSM 16646 / JW/IW-1228P) TaxID=555079 RepID=D9S2Y0_THEOJ|nr:hypothetical protein Toce_0995 [Thermosediminibacter oceani DSM 16646]